MLYERRIEVDKITMDPKESDLLNHITDYYLDSRDFNGYTIDINTDTHKAPEGLRSLIEQGLICLVWEDIFPNPFIKPFDDIPIQKQLDWLDEVEGQEQDTGMEDLLSQGLVSIKVVLCCAYPTKKHLKKTVSNRRYANKPFTRRLALGQGQLTPLYFESKVLLEYLKDPRYKLKLEDFSGTLYVADEKSLKDKIFIEHFGAGISKDFDHYERCITVLACDLMHMDSYNQLRWHRYLYTKQENYTIHPYYAASVSGHWPEKVSIFEAFKEELRIINAMTLKAYGEKLFKHDELEETFFSFVLIPTISEYNSFIATLSNLMGDNLSIQFFKELPYLEVTNSLYTAAGKHIGQSKGTISLLKEWLDPVVAKDPGPKIAMIETFKKVQKLRSSGKAHREMDDKYDITIFSQQKDLILEAYSAIRTLRLILQNHPKAKGISVPDWLFKGEICCY